MSIMMKPRKEYRNLTSAVNLHYVDMDRNKALGRMLNRFIDEGRFLDPVLIDKYNNAEVGNKIEKML